MKTYRFILIAAFFLFSSIAYGDIVPSNSHLVNKCVRITNMEDYPSVALLGHFVTTSMRSEYSTNLVSANKCLETTNKYTRLYIYAVKKDYIAGKDISSIDWSKDPIALKCNISFEDIYEGYVSDSDPITAIEQYYKIVGFTNTSVVLYKWKEVRKYKGKRNTTELFNYEGDLSKLSQNIK